MDVVMYNRYENVSGLMYNCHFIVEHWFLHPTETLADI